MPALPFPVLTADEAAAMIGHNASVGFSGFTAAGAVKAVPRAIAKRARTEHAAGKPYALRLIAGASAGEYVDEDLAQAEAIGWRTPFQSSKTLRQQINAGKVSFLDMHLSHLPQLIEFGFFGELDIAVVEATEVTPDGRVYLSTSGGVSPTLLRHAKKVIIEVNAAQSPRLWEMHDVAILDRPPNRAPIQILDAMDRIGTPFATVDPKRIVGVVHNDELDAMGGFDAPDAVSEKIAQHIVEFLIAERKAGRLPPGWLPLQAGVGNVANAVMATLGTHPEVPPFQMYTEVLQDSMVTLMKSGRLTGASTCSLTLSTPVMKEVFDNMDFFAPKVVMRPQELSNNPGVIRRLGVIALNTVLEMDIYGCVNSTHVMGTQLMNGIGGSGDFVRNSALSILMAPSVAKGGKISTVVPMVTHVDHTEHSIQVLVTEQGLADLRGLGPRERARLIIEKCAHPSYREYLHNYIETSPPGHVRHDLARVFELHLRCMKTGSMLG